MKSLSCSALCSLLPGIFCNVRPLRGFFSQCSCVVAYAFQGFSRLYEARSTAAACDK